MQQAFSMILLYIFNDFYPNSMSFIAQRHIKKTGLLSAVTIAAEKTTFQYLTLSLPDKICNSPYHQSYNSYNFSSENLILDQLIIPKLIFFFFLNTYLVDTVLILSGETLS